MREARVASAFVHALVDISASVSSVIYLVKHESSIAGALVGPLEVCAQRIAARRCEEHGAAVQMLDINSGGVVVVSSKDNWKDKDPAYVETVEAFELRVLQAVVARLARGRALIVFAFAQLFLAANE
eukprot:COSAG02_NODE_393_length_23190_cov_56.721926_4_plen_127_part_00